MAKQITHKQMMKIIKQAKKNLKRFTKNWRNLKMLKVHHTAWPIGREPKASNKIKESGLWYCKEGDDLVKEAHRLIQPRKPKNQIVTFARWFWAITAIASVITFFILNRR